MHMCVFVEKGPCNHQSVFLHPSPVHLSSLHPSSMQVRQRDQTGLIPCNFVQLLTSEPAQPQEPPIPKLPASSVEKAEVISIFPRCNSVPLPLPLFPSPYHCSSLRLVSVSLLLTSFPPPPLFINQTIASLCATVNNHFGQGFKWWDYFQFLSPNLTTKLTV